jgi:hypothetical protein
VHRVGVVIIVAAVAVQAVADTGGADRAAAEAKTRAANADFIGAAAKYREAFQAEPRPDLMCNVGVAYYKAKDLPRAQRYLDQCLSIGTSLERTFIDNVKKVLAAVDSALAGGSYTPVDLLVQPPTATTTVEGGVPFDEPLLGSRRVWFPFGNYKLTVHAEGHVDRVITIDAKDHSAIPARVSLELAPKPVDVGSAQEPDAGSGSAVVIEPPPPPPPPVTAKRSIVAPLVVSGVTVGLGVAALGYYLAAVDRANAAGKASDRQKYDALVDDARDRQHMSWLFSGAATAGAVVSGILWYRYASAPRVEVQASGSSAALTLGGRW